MQAEFRPPRRRTRVYEDYEAPLPLIRNRQDRKHYRGQLVHQQVLVCHPDHIQSIHSQGYFGKGVLSRARPEHSISDQWEQHKGVLLPVISQSRYEELLRWAEAELSSQRLDKEVANQTLLALTETVEGEVEANGAEEEPGGGACVQMKRPGAESEPEERNCRSDSQNLDLDSEPDSDSDPGSGVRVPGPGYVLVALEAQGGGGAREVRRSPLALTEYLQLSLEEAFFLVYSLGVLSVYQQQEPLSVVELWRKFRLLRPNFVSSYAAYHHFRSRGWVPKGGGGAKYGVDLMLYRKGPPFYHASYSVVVERTGASLGGAALRPFSWRSLAALSRITASVSKELMLCYIIYPTDLSEDDLDSPVCLSRLKVQEVIVSRWVSSRERAEQDDI
ncbi:LOW QUALITY PROTEIN: tRNA-splicing endonuclease subunit Sen2-like [Poeciliopsis prolifica]|uniref:LOW QUALITY PROTEIN: tRNA-splicing endonuclease subunit Sen2-like n=1 Tax=Poeciliopsis prolifica TaxID=188132 RepID=UPI00072D8252|nr:LOW QUALITY PROTEIN: tRNA-splicing endonuclease subunit Sen2-like [Poeciliopsis prolifica]